MRPQGDQSSLDGKTRITTLIKPLVTVLTTPQVYIFPSLSFPSPQNTKIWIMGLAKSPKGPRHPSKKLPMDGR